MAEVKSRRVVPAPGATTSPQIPGMVPDWTDIPAHVGEDIPAAESKVRPLTQYGTAEELAGVFRRKPMAQLEPADFEQAPPTYEEQRKANPANLTPIRPAPPADAAPPAITGDVTRELTTGE